jgi:hypothetical protein
LKEKLKRLKVELKKWNSSVFGDVQERRKVLVSKMNELDLIAESAGLSLEEAGMRQCLLADFWKIRKFHESILSQKSRSRWLKEGDSNSKYFHAIVNWKRKKIMW